MPEILSPIHDKEDRIARLEHDLAADLQRLSPEAAQLLAERLYKAVQRDDLPTLTTELTLQREINMLREPVPVHQFVYDEHYLGKSLKGSVYPTIVDDLIEVFEGNYIEVCLGGSSGWGRSREMEIGLAYEIYLLSCMRDPATAFGLIKGSTLVFLNVSVNLRQAKKALFGSLYELLQRSPYFNEVFPFDLKTQSELRFVRTNIVCRSVAASERAILGADVFSAAIDECDFMAVVKKSKRAIPGESGIYDQAQAVADKLATRIRSRFNQRGKLPGHVWYGCSTDYANGFTERKKQKAKIKGDIFIRDRGPWDVTPSEEGWRRAEGSRGMSQFGGVTYPASSPRRRR